MLNLDDVIGFSWKQPTTSCPSDFCFQETFTKTTYPQKAQLNMDRGMWIPSWAWKTSRRKFLGCSCRLFSVKQCVAFDWGILGSDWKECAVMSDMPQMLRKELVTLGTSAWCYQGLVGALCWAVPSCKSMLKPSKRTVPYPLPGFPRERWDMWSFPRGYISGAFLGIVFLSFFLGVRSHLHDFLESHVRSACQSPKHIAVRDWRLSLTTCWLVECQVSGRNIFAASLTPPKKTHGWFWRGVDGCQDKHCIFYIHMFLLKLHSRPSARSI